MPLLQSIMHSQHCGFGSHYCYLRGPYGGTTFMTTVRLAHLADGPVDSATGHDINPGTSIQFELLYFWKSSDDSIMINGIDTKQTLSRNAWFSIEDKECWHLKYEVSSAQNGIQRPMFFVRREGESLFMSRLV